MRRLLRPKNLIPILVLIGGAIFLTIVLVHRQNILSYWSAEAQIPGYWLHPANFHVIAARKSVVRNVYVREFNFNGDILNLTYFDRSTKEEKQGQFVLSAETYYAYTYYADPNETEEDRQKIRDSEVEITDVPDEEFDESKFVRRIDPVSRPEFEDLLAVGSELTLEASTENLFSNQYNLVTYISVDDYL